MTREGALIELLGSLFNVEELRVHLARERGGEDLVGSLPEGGVSRAAMASSAVDALQRRGLVDRGFFDDLEVARPARRADIQAVRSKWLDRGQIRGDDEESTQQPLTRPRGDADVGSTAEPAERRVFVAYVLEDKPWLDRLQVHLKPHLRGRPITLWEAGQLQAGTRRRDELERALTTAQAAILLVSADFLASESIVGHQLPRLLVGVDAERLAILPLVVGACAYAASPLEPFMPLNDPDRPLDELGRPEQNRELVRVAQQIARVFRERLGW